MRNQENENRLLQAVASYKHDPLGFVLFAFPSGEPCALQPWQAKELENIARSVRDATDEQVPTLDA
jgi:hypothetical protein